MRVALKKYPNSIQDWFTQNYPNVPLNCIHFANGHVDQSVLNPYASRFIVMYKETEDRIYLQGCIVYGTDEIVDFSVLTNIPNVSSNDPEFIEEPEPDLTLDLIKAHIDGNYFSLPTLQFILLIGRYVPHFFQEFTNRKRPLLVRYLRNFTDELDLLYEPTVYDLKRFWGANPKHRFGSAPPILWFNVPMEEITGNFLLYPGGSFHVAGIEMDNWVWRRLLRPLPQVRHHPEQVNHIIGYINSLEKRKRREHISLLGNPDDHLPPCMQINDRFPSDQDRQHFVRVLSAANVPIEYVREKLEHLNNLYPHKDGVISLKARWDFEYHYNAKYASPRCESMNCPLEPGKLIDVKKATCFKLYMQKFNKTPNHKTFYGPIKWFEW